MSEDDKKDTEKILSRIVSLEARIQEIRRSLLFPLENELHDLVSEVRRRNLGSQQMRVRRPVAAGTSSSSNPYVERIASAEIQTVRRELLDKSIDDLELSMRSAHCLQSSLKKPILRVGDLIMFTEPDLLRTKNFGRKSLREVNEILESMGLSLGSVHIDWEPSPGSAKPEDIQNHVRSTCWRLDRSTWNGSPPRTVPSRAISKIKEIRNEASSRKKNSQEAPQVFRYFRD